MRNSCIDCREKKLCFANRKCFEKWGKSENSSIVHGKNSCNSSINRMKKITFVNKPICGEKSINSKIVHWKISWKSLMDCGKNVKFNSQSQGKKSWNSLIGSEKNHKIHPSVERKCREICLLVMGKKCKISSLSCQKKNTNFASWSVEKIATFINWFGLKYCNIWHVIEKKKKITKFVSRSWKKKSWNLSVDREKKITKFFNWSWGKKKSWNLINHRNNWKFCLLTEEKI